MQYQCYGHFKLNDEIVSTITPNTVISLNKNRIIKEDATVFGELIDIGGEKPNIHIKINDDYKLIFDTSAEDVKRLGSRIYQKVVLKGTVSWDSVTFKILDFKLKEIVDYAPGRTFQAIEQLRKLTSGFWDKFKTNDDINSQLLRE